MTDNLGQEAHSWFSVFGVELEYMLVDVESLDVRPVADRLLAAMGGPGCSAVTRGPVAWSNELARHVIELKTNGPVSDLARVPEDFAQAVTELNALAAAEGACLMPSGMHPWMRPESEFQLWPYDPEGIYTAFDRIFDCRGHGWSNLQSMHLNLPFANDREFWGLHSAVRFLLPLLPALAASSPLTEGAYTINLDQRLAEYRTNARLVPQVSGLVVPEAMTSRAEYEGVLLAGIYAALKPHDPTGALCEEWVNARGAIARFDRMALEIRVLDAQECPRADLATAYLIVETLRPVAQSGHFCGLDSAFSAERLANIYTQVVHSGDEALVSDAEFLSAWGLQSSGPLQVKEIWQELLGRLPSERREVGLFQDAKLTVQQGPLARRIQRALGTRPERDDLRRVYRDLCNCLRRNERFIA